MYCCVKCGRPKSEHKTKFLFCPFSQNTYDEGGIKMNYGVEDHGNVGRTRNGSPFFYRLLDRMAETHDKKSHDYANNDNPCGNYHFAGQMSQLFKDPKDAGFMGRIAEKLYRLANLDNDGKIPKNETVEDTEIDLPTIMTLWMSDRQRRRQVSSLMNDPVLVMKGDIKVYPIEQTDKAKERDVMTKDDMDKMIDELSSSEFEDLFDVMLVQAIRRRKK